MNNSYAEIYILDCIRTYLYGTEKHMYDTIVNNLKYRMVVTEMQSLMNIDGSPYSNLESADFWPKWYKTWYDYDFIDYTYSIIKRKRLNMIAGKMPPKNWKQNVLSEWNY